MGIKAQLSLRGVWNVTGPIGLRRTEPALLRLKCAVAPDDGICIASRFA